ncbi:FTR1 family iron permease [Oscillatoria sp. FACHB-1407]|uniref:FTR1 family iron permease n=1 Tax=Oscillatoria sp. FACHB-1407 TaxID=2692847 RepID=UPI0016876AA6|nr:FTR1 family protein [Oscillatoria sp. FACHB-1407]MBD2464520.1 FTR1 family iron permease [Oscillatoria sp. FACHB-1407]
MNLSLILPSFIITLREGVEAALVVGIVLACLQKAKRTQLNSWVYLGLAAGVLVSALIGLLFGWIIRALGSASPATEPLLEAGFSAIAIVLLSWMLIWMTQQARSMRMLVEGEVTQALSNHASAAWGIFSLIFIAVLREGFETIVFIAAKFQQGMLPALGAFAGLVTAAVIGIALFKWGVKLNLRLFFQVMGVLLLLVVAGLVITTLGHADAVMAILAGRDRASASLCFYYEHFTRVHSCILGPLVWDFSAFLPDDQFPGLILSALFGYTQRLYQVQAIAYFLFLITVGGLYFQSLSGRLLPLRLQK